VKGALGDLDGRELRAPLSAVDEDDRRLGDARPGGVQPVEELGEEGVAGRGDRREVDRGERLGAVEPEAGGQVAQPEP